jgi:hypothetical protein
LFVFDTIGIIERNVWYVCKSNLPDIDSGAQAAAYANKTPSPAGAGFDHQSGGASQPAPIDQLQAWASQTGQMYVLNNILRWGDKNITVQGERHGRDHVVVGFITTYAIGAYRH